MQGTKSEFRALSRKQGNAQSALRHFTLTGLCKTCSIEQLLFMIGQGGTAGRVNRHWPPGGVSEDCHQLIDRKGCIVNAGGVHLLAKIRERVVPLLEAGNPAADAGRNAASGGSRADALSGYAVEATDR
jgi:hypothetical protein